MFGQTLLFATRFACVFASNPAGPSSSCTPSQLEVERVYTKCHRSILCRAYEIMTILEPRVSRARTLCREVTTMFECTQQSHIDKRYVEYVAHLATIRPCLQANRDRINYLITSVKAVLFENYALCTQMYNYFKYAKQYLRLAGLFCTHKPYEPVDTKAFKAMALEDMIDNTFKLGIQFSSAVTSIQKGYESLRDRDVVMSAEAKFSMLFHCKSLQLFKIILESLFPPIQALMLTTHKIDELARTILDVSSPAAAPSPLNLTFSRAFASRMNLEIAGHLAMLRIAARQFLWESNSEWLAGTTAAIDKANDWKAEKLLAERFLDVPVEQLPSASAMDDDLQDYAPGGLPAKALQCRLNFIE